jgi:hypothetical protein
MTKNEVEAVVSNKNLSQAEILQAQGWEFTGLMPKSKWVILQVKPPRAPWCSLNVGSSVLLRSLLMLGENECVSGGVLENISASTTNSKRIGKLSDKIDRLKEELELGTSEIRVREGDRRVNAVNGRHVYWLEVDGKAKKAEDLSVANAKAVSWLNREKSEVRFEWEEPGYLDSRLDDNTKKPGIWEEKEASRKFWVERKAGK